MTPPLTELTDTEFDHLIERHIEQAAQWDGTLPLDTLLQTWAEIERRTLTLEFEDALLAAAHA